MPVVTPAAARPNTSTGRSALNVEERLHNNQPARRGDAEWQVIRTPAHRAAWSRRQPDEQLLVVGDALSDDDVGCLNTAHDRPEAAAADTAIKRLIDLSPHVLLAKSAGTTSGGRPPQR